MVRALRDARERLRDAAAATHATATTAVERSGVELSDSCDRLEAFLDDASASLSAARTVYDIDRLHDLSGVYRLEISDAKARHAAATAHSEHTAGALRERTRQLRSAEKLVELVDDHLARAELRSEQRLNDDLASSAKKG
ncbi:MAG: flagellar FliJ family protein [Deltaproteobacteria bacterium]|nr:flagellar FliJ family protein [Deltaproteobacteria bacterium]MCW5808288.1 flagellar FliJ family protein [Deltaproteobacteria bacterium]